MERSEIKLILESFLFSSELPVKADKLNDIFPDIPGKELKEIINELKEEYDNLNRSVYIREVANGFQICTKPEYSSWIKKFKKIRPFRLTPATMETLAIVAYKQPITRAEVEDIRGVDTGGILRALLEKNLLKIAGKKDVPGKPLLYGTTPKFLTMFGLKGLKELPTLEDIKQLDENTLPLFSQKLQEEAGEPPLEPADQVSAEEDQNLNES